MWFLDNLMESAKTDVLEFVCIEYVGIPVSNVKYAT